MPNPTTGSPPAPRSNGPLAELAGAVMRRIHVPRLTAQSGSAESMRIGRIDMGDATVEDVLIQGVDASLDTGRVLMEDVRSVVDLRVGISFRVRAGPFRRSGEPSVNMSFPFNIGTVDVPELEDVELTIPSASLSDAVVEIEPIHNLNLGGGQFSGVQMDEADLPAAGFGLSGLLLGPVRMTDITVPAVTTASVSIEEFAPDGPLTLPAVEIRNISLPDIRAPRVSSVASVEIEDARASRQQVTLVDIDVFVGALRIAVFAEPTLNIHIGALTLDDVTATSSIDRIRMQTVRAPVTVRDVVLGDLRLEDIAVDEVTV